MGERMNLREEARRLARSRIRGDFTPEGLYTYTDENGEALYWRIRARLADGSKWIRPMRCNGASCEFGEPEFPNGKVLYRLHELVAKRGAPCWWVEGEQKADALGKLGMLATTAGGATSDERADFGPLAGRAVIIWPDNDKPGMEHAKRVAAKLCLLGCNVETLEVAALGLAEGGDFDMKGQVVGVTTAVVTQKGNAVEDSIVTVNSKRYVMFKAVPDGGDVLIGVLRERTPAVGPDHQVGDVEHPRHRGQIRYSYRGAVQVK